MDSLPMSKQKKRKRRRPPKPVRHRRYPPELKERAVELALRGDRTMKAVAVELSLPAKTLYRWVYEYEAEHGRPAPEGETPEEELKRLRKRVAQLEVDREILKKAATFFAKESG